MTRFMEEINGRFGEYWEKEAWKKVEQTRQELVNGEITIDENGVAYNCIGRPVVEEVMEALTFVTNLINVEATNEARDEYNARTIAEYRERMKDYEPTEEELFEMRSAFGRGTTVVNVLTGKAIEL